MQPRWMFAGALLLASLPAHPYESDLHYGLTYWLAAQAGFNALQSHEIARGDELTDTGMLDAKHAMIVELCIKRNEAASTLTRALHFRSQRPPPASAGERPVDPKPPYAEGQVRSVAAEPDHGMLSRLGRFGQALHGWQDAFSHQGVPNTPMLCPPEWMWAHPVQKGSALSHVADQTYRDTPKCQGVARRTYDWLVSYRQGLPLPAAKRWSAISSAVETFCKASTKTDKAAWFEKHGVVQADAIAGNTSLRDGSRNFWLAPRMHLGEGVPSIDKASARSAWLILPLYLGEVSPLPGQTPPYYEQQVPLWLPSEEILDKSSLAVNLDKPELVASAAQEERMRGFLLAWLTTPAADLPKVLAPYFGKPTLSDDDPWIQALRRLRLKDRNDAGDDGTALIPATFPAEAFVTATEQDWRELLIPVRGQEGREALLARADPHHLALVAILRHAPNDVLLMRTSDELTIEKLEVTVFH